MLCFLALVTLMVPACGWREESSRAAESKPELPTVRDGPDAGRDRGRTADAQQFATVLRPSLDVIVSSRTTGVVIKVAVAEGQWVRAGAALGQIDDRNERSVLEEREAELEKAKGEWNRGEALRKAEMISEEQLATRKANMKVALARRDQAAVQVDACRIVSPNEGMVARTWAKEGQLAGAHDQLFRILDDRRLQADIFLPEERARILKVGQEARVLPSGTESPIRGVVGRIDRFIDPASRTLRVTLFVKNTQRRVDSGVSATVDFGNADQPPSQDDLRGVPLGETE